MRVRLYFIFRLFLALSYALVTHAVAQVNINKEFCQDELNKQIRNLIASDDSEILMNSFNLASLKLSYKVISNENELVNQDRRNTLEKHIKNKLGDLSKQDKNQIRQKVKDLYKKFKRPADINKINNIISTLDEHSYFPKSKRLSNEDISVLMMAYELIDPCEKSSLCIDENDTAIMWFMDEISKKVEKDTRQSKLGNMLRSTVQVAHHNGVFSNTIPLSLDEVEKKINNLSNKNRKKIKEFNKRFLDKYQGCIMLLGGESCFAQAVNDAYQSNLNEILENLNEQQITSIPNTLKVKLSDGLSFNLANNLLTKKVPIKTNQKASGEYPSKLNLPAVIVDGDKPFTCNGISYQPEIKLKKIWSFDPYRLWENIKNAKNPWKEADRRAQRKMDIVKDKADKGNKAAKMLSLFQKLCPPIPISVGAASFKCAPFVKWLVLRNKIAETDVCCNDEIVTKEFSNLFVGTTGGIEAKIFFGIPYLAEIGGIGGGSATLNLGGGGIPEGCSEKKCIQGSLLLNFYAGVYVNVGIQDTLRSAVGAEGKFSFKPYATARQCLYPTGKLPPAEVKLSLGALYVQGTVYAGWVFAADFYHKIWESKKEDTFSIAIF